MDMSKYLGLFASEASEHVEALGRELLALEKDRAPDRVDSIFRHAHSVKGMAASMGFDPIARLAHRVEDLLGAVREKPQALTGESVDLLLRATDALGGMVALAGAGSPFQDEPALVQALSEQLGRLQPGQVVPVQAPPPAVELEPAPAPPGEAGAVPGLEGFSRLKVRVKVSPSCATPGVRAFLVHKKLSAMGQIFDCRPPLEDLRAGRIPEGLLTLVVETRQGTAAVRKVLSQVSDLELAEVAGLAESFKVRPTPLPAAPVSTPAAEALPVGAEPSRTVKVKTELLDHFLDAVGELLLATAHLRELTKALPERHQASMEEGVDRLHGIVKGLHDKVMSARMTPLSLITDRLPRAARDIARRTGREAELLITGAEIELDRAILDELADPILHILRNCLDHGLEPPEERAAKGKPAKGQVRVAARRERDRVLVEVEDDGRGMDLGRLKAAAIERGLLTHEQAEKLSPRETLLLSCLPGVSTAKAVSDLSGRGVGMDAVKRAVESVGGNLEIDSEVGRGTRFTLRLPLTVAVVNVLLIGVGEEIYGLPIAKVVGAVEQAPSSLRRSSGSNLLSHAGALLPAHALSQLLEVPPGPETPAKPYVVLEGDAGRLALQVDHLLGQEEVVLKPLTRPLDRVPGLSGVTILGTGRPIFILDVPRLV